MNPLLLLAAMWEGTPSRLFGKSHAMGPRMGFPERVRALPQKRAGNRP